MTETPRRPGTVKTWNEARAYGFIRPADGTADVFLHLSAIWPPRQPAVGDQVTYRAEADQRGRRRAADVEFVE